MTEPKRIFITGASTGIGAALAIEYAGPGVTLGLAARRAEILEEVKKKAESREARVLLYPLDVSDRRKVEQAARSFMDDAGGADLIIANAGYGITERFDAPEDLDALTGVIDVNLKGMVHTVAPFLAPMGKRGAGHLCATGSVAGFRGLVGGSYSATKAAVKTMMDAWRLKYGSRGLYFTTICPGFIETPLTAQNKFPMPFLMSSDRAARMIRRAVAKRKKTYVFPWQWRLIIPVMKILPDRVLRRLAP